MISTQLDLFQRANVEIATPDLKTEVKLGHHSARVPLRKQRRAAITRLMEILGELEGKDIYIGSYDAGGRHYWINNLKLQRLQLEYHPYHFKNDTDYIPGVIVLWGNRGGSVRIFTDYLTTVREQEYLGYWQYLLDFHNGFWESQIDNYRSHYACLHIIRFKD